MSDTRSFYGKLVLKSWEIAEAKLHARDIKEQLYISNEIYTQELH